MLSILNCDVLDPYSIREQTDAQYTHLLVGLYLVYTIDDLSKAKRGFSIRAEISSDTKSPGLSNFRDK